MPRKRLEPGDVGFDWDAPRDDSALNEAKAFLASQAGSQDPWAPAVQEQARAADLSAQKASAPKTGLRGFTEMLAAPAPALGMAALGTGLSGIGAPAAPALGLASGMMAAPDILRRMISPDEDESRGWAAGEGALYALPAAGAVAKSAMRGFRNAAKPAGGALKSSVSSYGGVGKNVSGLNTPPGNVAEETAQQLPESWKQFVRPEGFRGKAEAAAPYVRPDRSLSPKLAALLRQGGSGLDETAFASSGRNLNTSNNPLLDLLPDGSEMIQPEYGPNLMDNFRRLAIPARARAFRNNTPFPE